MPLTCRRAQRRRARPCSQTRSRPRARAAQDVGALFVNVIPWMCSAVCTPIIGNMLVYENQYHITKTYATYLSGALESALAPVLGSSTTPAS